MGKRKGWSWGRKRPGREVVRGLFHGLCGVAMWLIMHPFPIPDIAIWLCGVGIFATFMVFRHVRGSRSACYAKFNHIIDQWLARDVERGKMTAAWPTYVGCLFAWVIICACNTRWIGALTALLFGMVDPLARLGMKWPLGKRFKNEKSLGGLLFGFLGGLLAIGLIAIVCHCGVPLVTAPSLKILAIVYAVGLITASFFEFIGGRWDNFIIPAGTTVAMTVVYYALL